ncbi:hypothetical protein PInf_000742 [Phytophthora infestans]|nr:hypothetical protein PInf_000742 [Phytophthora infestans]
MEAEAQLARALVTLTGREFPLSRGKETRIDAYLQLEDLLCLEDSEESVLELQRHVPSLLSEIRYDLQHKTLSDVLHAALRCLSYLMHHYSLAAAFSDEHMTFFLGELVHLLFSTQDQSTYKLCLWGLTMQNFPAERHKLLSRTVEGLVQAVVNPFKSRAIEVQALKGLHLLLVKYPEQLGVDGAVLGIYVRPIASRLASSETATRTQARLILEEASKHLPKWSQETLTMVQHCAEKYMLPVMKLHMENDRQKDAVCLWKLTLVLLKSQFSNDLGKLNKVLYVPEKCMEDEDAAARLMAMQAWSKVVEIFHECHNWLFNKAVVSLLVWPIKLSLEQELLLNVVDAAFESWRRIVSVAVCDFNAYCKAQQQAGEQQNVPEWKFWFGELVMTPLLTLMKKRMRAKDSASTVELDQFIIFTKQLCELEKPDPVKSKNSPSRIEDSSNTTLGGSSVDASTASKGGELKPVEVQSCGSHITSELIGVAFLLEDIFGAVQHLIKLSDESGGLESKRRVNDLVVAMWKGVCNRIHLDSKRDGPASNFELRLVRMCIDFCFGILTSTSTSAEMLGVSSPTNRADKSTEGRPAKVVLASVGFGLEWQLQLFAPLVSGVATPRDLQTVILHPKSKLSDHITQRMEYLKNMYVQCAAVLQRWKDSELLIDFTAKENALPYLVINLLFEYSVFVDDTNNDNSDAKYSTLTCLETVVNKLSESMKAGAQHSRELDSVVRFSEESIRAAHDLLAYDFASGKSSMLDELVSVSKGLTRHAFASRQNASLSVDLCQSRGKVGVSFPPEKRVGVHKSRYSTPSPHKPSKRPFHLESGSIAPLSLEKRDHKRTKRSLVLDGEDGDEEESEGTRRKPKLADRVTFCLQTGETGETRITRPGEDSQDQLRPSEKVEEKESAQEKMDTYTLKLLQHLRRSAYYMDKLVAEEESMQSEEASLGTTIANVGGVITNYQEAHDLVSRLASQLQIAAETSSKRCRKLLDKRG